MRTCHKLRWQHQRRKRSMWMELLSRASGDGDTFPSPLNIYNQRRACHLLTLDHAQPARTPSTVPVRAQAPSPCRWRQHGQARERPILGISHLPVQSSLARWFNPPAGGNVHSARAQLYRKVQSHASSGRCRLRVYYQVARSLPSTSTMKEGSATCPILLSR
jgi:hypothetical protein